MAMPKIDDETLSEVAGAISSVVSEHLLDQKFEYGELTITVKRGSIVDVLRFLRDDSQTQFWNIIDICGVDYPQREERFDVVYHLLSPRVNARIRVKVSTDEEKPVPSVTGLYPGANWFEREAWVQFVLE